MTRGGMNGWLISWFALLSPVGVILTLIMSGHAGFGFWLSVLAMPLWVVALLPASTLKRRKVELVAQPSEREQQIEAMLAVQMERLRLERLADELAVPGKGMR